MAEDETKAIARIRHMAEWLDSVGLSRWYAGEAEVLTTDFHALLRMVAALENIAVSPASAIKLRQMARRGLGRDPNACI